MTALMPGGPEQVDRRVQLEAARLARTNTTRRTAQSVALGFGIVVTSATACVVVAIQLLHGSAGYASLELLVARMLVAGLRARRRRLTAPSGEQVLADDPRPPVVWLRPFELDGALLRPPVRPSWRRGAPRFAIASLSSYGIRPPTYEEHLTRALRDVAPVIGLGDPVETLPRRGAARIYVDDADWRSTIAELLARDGTIILHLGDSPRLRWEAQQVAYLGEPERLIISLPRDGERGGGLLDRGRARIGRMRGGPPRPARAQGSRQDHYEQLRPLFSDVFAARLPKYIGDSQFIYFSAGCAPSLFPLGDVEPPQPRAGSPSEQRDLILARLGEEFRIRYQPTWVGCIGGVGAVLMLALVVLILAGVLD